MKGWNELPDNIKIRVVLGKKELQKDFEKAEIEQSTPETVIQQQVVKWFAYTYPEIYKTGALFAVPNEGKRTRATASRMKAEGMFPGVADLILLLPRGVFHGACIEMKSKGGKLTPEQIAWGNSRILSGYFVEVCFSFKQAIKSIEQYINLK